MSSLMNRFYEKLNTGYYKDKCYISDCFAAYGFEYDIANPLHISLSSRAYDEGHSAGSSEVAAILISLIQDIFSAIETMNISNKDFILGTKYTDPESLPKQENDWQEKQPRLPSERTNG